MGIEITTGFKVYSTDPIDKQRFLFNNLADLLAMPLTWRHPGMRTYVLDIAGGGVGKGYYELIGTANVNPIHNDNWVKLEPATVAVINDRGNWDASTGAYPSTGGSGVDGEIQKGDFWYVSVSGVAHGVEFNVGDNIRARVDAPGDVNSDWAAIEGNLGYVPENKAARRTNLIDNDNNTYPTTKAVNDGLATKDPVTIGKTIATLNYTLDATDSNAVIVLTGAAAQSITLPSDATAAIPNNTKVRFAGNSNFAKTFVQGVGATVISPRGLLMDGFKGFVVAEKIAANTWFLSGDLIEPVTAINTTGTVTINTQLCNRLILDMEGKEWKKFKYVGDDTWLGLDVINRVEGAQFVLEIERSTSTNMSMRFVQYSELYADTQIIDNAQLVIKGKATGRTLAKIAGQISTYSAGANAGLANTITYLERTNINS